MTVARLLPQTAQAAHSPWRVVNVRGERRRLQCKTFSHSNHAAHSGPRVVNVRGKRRRFRCKTFSHSNRAAHSGPSYDWQCCLIFLTMVSGKTLRETTAVVKRSVACSSAADAHL